MTNEGGGWDQYSFSTLSYMTGRVPEALFNVLLVNLIAIASITSLEGKSGHLLTTDTFSQSTGWPADHACAARTEELKSADFTPLLCSQRRWFSLQPNNIHGIV